MIPYTMQLLELLARWQVRATFFLMGSYVRQRPEIARAIHQAGHLLGNHTVSHPSLMWASPAQVREELIGCSAIIEDATGEAVKYVSAALRRAPAGCAAHCEGTWADAGDVECDRL